jgi:pimeloyl-ACP methyl ester carboxylesterase
LAVLQKQVVTMPTPVPALALHGTKDRPGRLEAFERMGEFFAAGFEKVLFPGTGHFPHLECPGEVNAKIVEFLRRP